MADEHNLQNSKEQLLKKLDTIFNKQIQFEREIETLRKEIESMGGQESSHDESASPQNVQPPFEENYPQPSLRVVSQTEQAKQVLHPEPESKYRTLNWEKFIGENLMNKIGVIIIVIGVAIGGKYAVDHQMVNPLTRIVLGYLTGLGLLGFAIRLKQRYENFSAALLSGSMAILYFITFFAYDFYNLIPQAAAFGLMTLFTIFTVLAAINYNKQVIAHIGLVGAYTVPFLLSDGSGRVVILFSYMAIINAGILLIAFTKYWKALFYSAFSISWLIFFAWYTADFNASSHFTLTFVFLFIFFATFYTTFLLYKLMKQEQFEKWEIVILLANSFIFYGIGYSVLSKHVVGKELLGIFTLCNALMHFVVSAIIYRRKTADKNLLYFVSGLVLVFITIAIPVQLDANWVTLLWAFESVLLFWIGRTKDVSIYEKLSYPLMVLAFFSIIQDWMAAYMFSRYSSELQSVTPLFNIHFLTSLLVATSYATILIIHQREKYRLADQTLLVEPYRLFNFMVPTALLIVTYFSFYWEISLYFTNLIAGSEIITKVNGGDYRIWNRDLMQIKNVCIFNYTMLFFSGLSVLNAVQLKNKALGSVNLVLNALALLLFLTIGLFSLSELRESFLHQSQAEYYEKGMYHITLRYVSYFFAGILLACTSFFIRRDLVKRESRSLFNGMLHATILWCASSEYIHWMTMVQSTASYKLGLSILWGFYSVLLIVLGIWKKKPYLRFAAIALFAVTLIKLFFYDIAHLETIAKTIVFVSLGILLLVISFLYNKYKNTIFDDNEQ